MINKLASPSDLEETKRLAQSVVGETEWLSSHWIAVSGARVLAQESGRHLEDDDALVVSNAYASAGIRRLYAVVIDALITDDEAYVLSASPSDLVGLSDELMGINFLLADSHGTCCILFTAYDFKFIAGPIDFVIGIAGDPISAKKAFEEFASGQLESFRSVLDRAESYMDWVEVD